MVKGFARAFETSLGPYGIKGVIKRESFLLKKEIRWYFG
jgi:hypothetical protein